MSDLDWNIDLDAIKWLCINTAFYRDERVSFYSIENLVSHFFHKNLDDFKSVDELIEAVEAHPVLADSLESAKFFFSTVFDGEPPAGLSLSTYECYDVMYELNSYF